MNEEENDVLREMDKHLPVCTFVHSGGAYFTWGWEGCGFGEFSFRIDPKDGQWWCDNEGMGPESTRKILHAFADYVADNLKPVIEEHHAAEEQRRKSYETQGTQASEENQASDEGNTTDRGPDDEGTNSSE